MSIRELTFEELMLVAGGGEGNGGDQGGTGSNGGGDGAAAALQQAANSELTLRDFFGTVTLTTDAELINQAKAMILKLRGEASFDKAYMNNQVVAHEQTIELFNKAVNSEDAEIAAFAKETLPKLEHHLMMAKDINSKLPEN